MSPEEIQAMAKGLAEGQAAWYVLSAIIGGLITGAGAYLAEKGKNRATKEDIGELTKAVEATKLEFSKQLEDLKAQHQMRMVAAEKRIEAHQNAFMLGRKLSISMHSDSHKGWAAAQDEAYSFFEKNALYLGVKTRETFAAMVEGVENYRELRMSHGVVFIQGCTSESPAEARLREIYEREIRPWFDYVTSEVELPPLNAGYLVPHPAKVRP